MCPVVRKYLYPFLLCKSPIANELNWTSTRVSPVHCRARMIFTRNLAWTAPIQITVCLIILLVQVRETN